MTVLDDMIRSIELKLERQQHAAETTRIRLEAIKLLRNKTAPNK